MAAFLAMRRAGGLVGASGAAATWSRLHAPCVVRTAMPAIAVACGEPVPLLATAAAVGVPTPGHVRGVITTRRRNADRRARRAELNALAKYAARFDPMRTCVREVYQTLDRLAWPFEQNYPIAEGLTTMFALVNKKIAIEVAAPSDYVTPPVFSDGVLETEAKFVDSVNAKLASFKARGWSCIVVHQPEWARRRESKNQHDLRAHYIQRAALSLVQAQSAAGVQ